MVPKITLDRSYLEQVQLDQTPLVRDRMYDIIYAALKVKYINNINLVSIVSYLFYVKKINNNISFKIVQL